MEWVLYRIGIFLSNLLPRRIAYRIAAGLGFLQFYFSGRDRQAVRKNLDVILKKAPSREKRKKSRLVFVNFAKYLVDFFRLERLNKDFIARYVKIENISFLDELIKKSGVIIVTAHIGNWELGGAVAAYLGYPLYAIALPHKNKKVNDFFDNQRKRFNLGVIPVGMAVRKCFALLKNKKMVAFLGDRDFMGGGKRMIFLQKPAYLPVGAAVFCRKTLAPIVPAFFLRQENDNFSLIFEKPILPYNEAGILRSEDEILSDYARVLERYVSKYPEQWYMFQPFWPAE